MPGCSWITKTWGTKPDGTIDYASPPEACGKKVGWLMVKDDDENTVRKYNNFCADHQAQLDAMPHNPEDEFCNCKECR